ncbi:MAG: Fe-S cluster assembly protein SufD [Mariprofundaceae bacterium]
MSQIVDNIRDQGRATFAKLGIPTTRLETWKYTDVKRAMAPFLDQLGEVTAVDSPDAGIIEQLAISRLDAYRLLLVDGRVHSEASELPDGVEATSLAKLLTDKPEQGIEPLTMDEDAPLFNGFVALNAAHAQDGVGICIGKGIRLDKPLYIQHVSTGKVAHVCHGIHLGEQAEASIIEHYTGIDDAAGFTNVVTQVRLSDGSKLKHIRLQQESIKQTHIGRVSVQQHRDSRYNSHSIALGAALSRVDLVTALADTGAACDFNGLYLTIGRQHADHHTVIDHQAPHCVSREMYRGVMDGRSRAVFNGRVVVREGAIKTDSAQSNANLLLSARAEVDTKPELEIYNDDVKCAHGATIGQLDANQLFYLQSRGLSEEEARQLLTFAFADEVLASLDIAAVRRHIEHAAFNKLPHGADIEDVLATDASTEASA